MRMLPAPRTVRLARVRANRRFLLAMGIATIVFAAIVGVSHVLGW